MWQFADTRRPQSLQFLYSARLSGAFLPSSPLYIPLSFFRLWVIIKSKLIKFHPFFEFKNKIKITPTSDHHNFRPCISSHNSSIRNLRSNASSDIDSMSTDKLRLTAVKFKQEQRGCGDTEWKTHRTGICPPRLSSKNRACPIFFCITHGQ